MKLLDKIKKPNQKSQLINSKNAEQLKMIASQSGISWHELYYINENKYFTCFQVVEYPESSRYNWMRHIINSEFAFLSVNISHVDEGSFISAEDANLEKQGNVMQDAKKFSQNKRARDNIEEFSTFSKYIENSKNTVKTITLRIFVFGKTLDELQEHSDKITNILYREKMRAVIQTNNLLEDYQSLTNTNNPTKQFVSSGTLADMTLNSNISIVDYHAGILGITATGVYAPNVYSTKNYNYNIAYMGGMGSGKSAVSKKHEKNNLIKGNHVVYIFDIHEEYDEYAERLKIESVSITEQNTVNLMQLFFVDNAMGDAIIRENDIQVRVESIKETFKSFTGITRETTALRLGKFLTEYYDFYLGKDLNTLNNRNWKTLSSVRDAVNDEIRKIQTGDIKLDDKEPTVIREYAKDLYNLQTGLNAMVDDYGYLFNKETTIDFDLSKPLRFDISFLQHNDNTSVKSAFVSLLMNYVGYGVFLNQERNHAKEKETGVRIADREEPYFTHQVLFDEFMQYSDDRGFLTTTTALMKFMRKAYSGLSIIIHTTNDTRKSLENAGDLLGEIFKLCTHKYIGRTDYEDAMTLPSILQGVTFNDAEAVSKFKKGQNGERQFLVVDGQDRKLFFTSLITKREQSYFKGGV